LRPRGFIRQSFGWQASFLLSTSSFLLSQFVFSPFKTDKYLMTKNNILLVATVAASISVAAIANAGTPPPEKLDPRDKPYYTHGPRYWNGDTEMVWQPGTRGMWGNGWVHGIYVQGQHRKPTANAPKETTPPAKH
jgi:hypothetical protein